MEITPYQNAGVGSVNENFKPRNCAPCALNLGSQDSKVRKQLVTSSFLNADDINKLKLSTPDMELYILKAFKSDCQVSPSETKPKISGQGLTEEEVFAKSFKLTPEGYIDKAALSNPNPRTPTPTLFKLSGHSVTPEEASTMGFMDILALCYPNEEPENFEAGDNNMSREGMGFSSCALPAPTTTSTKSYTELLPANQSTSESTALASATIKSHTSSLLLGVWPSSVESSSTHPSMLTQYRALPKNALAKEELQTVPSDSLSMSLSPPVSPMDIEEQDRIKKERKRYSNRMAAERCRKKKVARISQLEIENTRLKDEISKLNDKNTIREEENTRLKDENARLRSQIYSLLGGSQLCEARLQNHGY